ncbi:Rieske (2Fe-2S) protein [Pseudonocardia sp. KRD-184]|uniref:Cytochrome bc1 complex Rieske iron-sulfur subunit n=1 Tax=Pseudonocardia oceani TaxID=2792013 RepID=A0ABS6UDW1_9PSEU|nr:Rieske (2Fe-2S) protein [Pseudonocardia oceani]MBW0088165.1 Rieske (2Fe-2S) protein [Pseudonocardia oceani]MBW0094804.1 Rieske (2Fe-2S) protein [Pseudonocardia oceani]MBW0107582.1 Rieske (2Fe-2S) protein [Pseudonocardia oceani]MBW0121035.1 Rieske (2Fe-2S) protein [Pseudonocardia oceani]MBW0130426.1 Rieske (2Fe-2S) protein [Pseudonocardia oceani]
MPDTQIDRRTVVIGAAALTAGLTVAGCASGAGSAPAATGPLATTTDVPVGGATIFADRAVVVTQATAGSFAAFSTVCPHQGCNVNAVEGAEIICPCHDSRFDLTGAVLTGPAESGLAAVPVTVSGTEITLG